MSGRIEETLPATRHRSRKSIAHIPNSAADKENMTAEIGALGSKKAALGEKKKSRSKSIGPGGLDALSDSTGNRRQSIMMPAPRSILKPTIPPLQEIPARRTSPRKEASSSSEDKSRPEALQRESTSITGGDALTNPFSIEPKSPAPESKVLLRTEEEQQQAAKDREENERKAMEKDINARRDARRKSLANRRVSFAPEATLHTWDVVEYMQDSTTSSSSTSSTRRASSASSATPASPHPSAANALGSDPSEPPSTPPEQLEDEPMVSPAHQRDLHQKKRRRSSGIPPLNFNNPDDEFLSSSPYSGESGIDDDEIVEDASDSNSESDDDGTAMILDEGDTTNMSIASERSMDSSTGSSAKLEEALRLASKQAGTQRGGFAEDDAEDDIASFTPWTRSDSQSLSAMQDQENVNPFSPAFKTSISENQEEGDGMDVDMEMTQAVGRIMPGHESEDDMTMDMTMDMTSAIGGILPPQQNISVGNRRKSAVVARQNTRRASSGVESSLGDEAMDFTTAIGGIQQARNLDDDETAGEDEDMTMEFTSVIGGVLPAGRRSSTAPKANTTSKSQRRLSRRISAGSADNDATMDMTVAVGSILPPADPTAENDDNDTFSMDMTTAVGSIIHSTNQPESRIQAKRFMEEEVDSSEPVTSPQMLEISTSVTKPIQATMASETGSPSLTAFRGKGLRRSGAADRTSTTPKTKNQASIQSTPVKTPSTPAKQITPKPTRPSTPAGKTPPSNNIGTRSASPKRLFSAEMSKVVDKPHSGATKKNKTPTKAAAPSTLFQKDAKTGLSTPSVVLSHKRRRSSGLGIDKEGIGSPRIAAILDRRGSIGEKAESFSPGQFQLAAPAVRFNDALEMEAQIDRERKEEEDRENGRKIMEREADITEEQNDATINLKEMIQSLTPKKKAMKGRKSLHVGAARGILGKRPAELDDSSEDDESGVKRLKNHQGSPVKNVKLQAPPSKEETTGGLKRSTRKGLEITSNNIVTPTAEVVPTKTSISTPRSQGRFKDVEKLPGAQEAVPFVEHEPVQNPENLQDDQDEEPMHLQDFLNLTSIRFMELTTTKRRPTLAAKRQSTIDGQGSKSLSLEDCVAACACTIPMLELFQHSCRELKKYISEGRGVVREIEAESFEENPPLFREYLSATPDVRTLMDNQFKNVKTHARLTAKGMWYEWRMTLLSGLSEGLVKMAEGMHDDSEVVQHQLDLLDSVLPSLTERHSKLVEAEAELKSAAHELADCDQEELQQARQSLTSLNNDVEAKKRIISELQAQVKDHDARIESSSARKLICQQEIQRAEKVREECRGWTGNEVLALKAKVDSLEAEHGWTVTGVSKGTIASMSYRSDLELVFDVSSFKTDKNSTNKQVNSQIDLWYIGENRDSGKSTLTMEKTFFVDNIRDHVRGIQQAASSIRDLLDTVSSAWSRALGLIDQIQSLRLALPTDTSKTSDKSILVTSSLLLTEIATKVLFNFELSAESAAGGLDIEVRPSARVVYGHGFNEGKMTEFVIKRIIEGEEDWSTTVLGLEEKLLARGRK